MAVGAAVSIGTRVLGFASSQSARRKLRRARRLQALNTLQRNLQRRRSFIRQARSAQAATAVSATAFAGGLDSSAFQGTRASIATQEGFALHEFDESRRRSRKAAQLTESAEQDLQFGKDIQAVGSLFSQASDAFS